MTLSGGSDLNSDAPHSIDTRLRTLQQLTGVYLTVDHKANNDSDIVHTVQQHRWIYAIKRITEVAI